MNEITVPKFDVNDDSVTITAIMFKNGEYIRENDVLFKAESTKMTKDIYSDADGYISICVNEFDKVKIGAVIARLFKTIEECEEFNKDYIKEQSGMQNNNKAISATAKAISLAKAAGINLEEISVIKENGVIKASDVEQYINEVSKNSILPKTNKNSSSSGVPVTINPYDRERVMIIGAGRLSEQVIDILLDDKDKYIVGLVDSNKTEYESYNFPLYTCDIFAFPEKIDKSLYDTVIIALGGDKNAMTFRKKLYELYKDKGVRFTNAIGDNTNIRRAVRLGDNNIIMHNCFVGTGAAIGSDNIISYGTCIGHHCVVGSHNLFAPAVITPGSVKIGDNNILMTGVKTINYITIGDNTVLPVGYNVCTDIPDNSNYLRNNND